MSERKLISGLLANLKTEVEEYLSADRCWIGGRNQLLLATASAVAELLRREQIRERRERTDLLLSMGVPARTINNANATELDEPIETERNRT